MNNTTFRIAFGLLVLIAVLGLLAPFIGFADPTAMQMGQKFAGPSAGHWLGQDEFGRDVLSRLVWGARVSLYIALSAALIATVIGTTLGIIGGYFGGVVEFISLRSMDVLLCFPPMLLALLIVTIAGPGPNMLIPVLALVYVPNFTRVSYASVLSLRQQEFVSAEEAMGASRFRIMFRTILPNITGPVLVQFSLTVAACLILESGLSFLGLGVVPPDPSWGLMIGAARSYLSQSPELLLWPCLALTITILLVNTVCDGLRDRFDPTSK